MIRALRSRVGAVERARREEAGRGVTWGDVMEAAARGAARLEALPPAERERREGERSAAGKAKWGRALAGRMAAAELDREFPPFVPPASRDGWTWGHYGALVLEPFRRLALVNRSRREHGLPAGCDWRHPDWPGELARLGLGEPRGSDVPEWEEDADKAAVRALGRRSLAEHGARLNRD